MPWTMHVKNDDPSPRSMVGMNVCRYIVTSQGILSRFRSPSEPFCGGIGASCKQVRSRHCQNWVTLCRLVGDFRLHTWATLELSMATWDAIILWLTPHRRPLGALRSSDEA